MADGATELQVVNVDNDDSRKDPENFDKDDNDAVLPNCPLESCDIQRRFFSLTALEILREAVTVFRVNPFSFLTIAVICICPVSAIILSNALADGSSIKKVNFWLTLTAEGYGLPLNHYVRLGCRKLAENIVAFGSCFPFFATFLLFGKAAVMQFVVMSYVGENLYVGKTLALLCKVCIRLLSTFLFVCVVMVGCLVGFLILLLGLMNLLMSLGIPSYYCVGFSVIGVGFTFSMVFAQTVVVCNMAVVISVLEGYYGLGAFLRSKHLIKGRISVGLAIFVGTSIGIAFVEGLFEHRVKSLSYGDGSSRIWEAPLLVIMHSYIVLMDTIMNCIFYFSCKSSSPEGLHSDSFLEHT